MAYRRASYWLAAWLALAGHAVQAAALDAAEIERGRYLVYAGGCISCHTADSPDAVPLAGGRSLATPFGTFWSPNITPDPVTGIGRFTVEDVVRALKSGISPEGHNYFPVFPYTSYAGMTDADARAIGAYLLSLEPVSQPARPHELPWYLGSRIVMSVWNLLNFWPAEFTADATKSSEWNRGAYLVRHLGHCGECHSPRNFLGAVDNAAELSGNPEGPEDETIPNITPDRDTGIGKWTADDIVLFLEMGMLPDGDFAGSSMSDVIDDNTGKLTAADRQAIATYLLSLPPLSTPKPTPTPAAN